MYRSETLEELQYEVISLWTELQKTDVSIMYILHMLFRLSYWNKVLWISKLF